MNLPIEEIRQKIEGIIRARSSLTDEQVAWLADDYLEGELQGKFTHGLLASQDVVPKLAKASSEFKILIETDSLLYVDAHGSFGSLVGRAVVDLVAAKAVKQGISVAFIRDMKSWLRPATFAQQLADHGLVGFVTNNGGYPSMVPPGGRELAVGTNPIGIGIPTNGDSQVVDMATSVHAWGEVRKAKHFGTPLPDQAFVDIEGQVTTDPNAATATLPLGSHKGFALALLIEVLGGSLVNMPMGGDEQANVDNLIRNRGAMILVLDPAITVGRNQFEQKNSAFFNKLRSIKPVEGGNPITLPGDRTRTNRATAMEAGSIEVDDKLWAEIQALSYIDNV